MFLADALHGRLVIRHGITRTAVQQSVVARPVAPVDVGTLEQQRFIPRSEQSRAIPAPVAPPPMMMTSYVLFILKVFILSQS